MTVTYDQALLIATLAVACRPERAPTWDMPGTLAAIGRVKGRPLAEVALAVIRAAADRDALTPGVIPTAGSHWAEQLKPEPWKPDRGPLCGECFQTRTNCEANPHLEHTFTPRREVPAWDVAAIVAELRVRMSETDEAMSADETDPTTEIEES